MKAICLYLLIGVLWMIFEELVATLGDNEKYQELCNSMNILELLFIRIVSVILWPIPMAIWFRSFQSNNKKES